MENQVKEFEQANLEVFKELSDFKKQQEKLKQSEEKVKAYLLKQMEEYGVKSLKNEYITISHVEASTTTSVDLKKLQEKEPECYAGLIADYPKVTKKKAYVRFTVK